VGTFADVHETLKPYYALIALALTWAGLLLAWWRRRTQWHNKEFLGQINFSVNLFGDTLSMRTLLEVETAEVFPNAYGAGLLHKAAKRTTLEQPFIHLAEKDDRDYLHRAVKNTLSELCSTAFIGVALGQPVRRSVFVFALTCERYPEMRTIKLRVLLVERETLREWCAPGGKGESLPITPYYRTRLRTLQAMHEMDRKAQAGELSDLGSVELAIPAG